MKYAQLISQMTLEEKASLCSGGDFWHTKAIERLGIPAMMLTDGPHGLRKQLGKSDHAGLNKSVPATCFPTASALANSWDAELLEQVGECLGAEAAAEDVSVLLGPGLNIKRDPRCGRNFEYFSEDPYLAGKLAAALIRGIQSKGVSACPKHFAVNSQEHRRMSIDEIVDERALREIYLEGFRYAVTEGKPKCLMSSYNRINGTYANENPHTMSDILRGEWGYEGVVVTDWGGNNDRVAGLKAGNQLEMPSANGMTDKDIVNAVNDGSLDEAVLDDAVNKILTLLYDTHDALGKGRRFTWDEHHTFAREAASRCAVLVKNDNNILPLKAGTSVAVIGDFAANPRYQGAGSSLIVPTKLDNALEELKKTGLWVMDYAQGFKRSGGKSEKLKEEAFALAANADVALLFMGLDEASEAEGVDRAHIRVNENQLELLKAFYDKGIKTVVIFTGGAPVECQWMKYAQAVLLPYLGGQAGAGAVADIISGKKCPCGKLAESYPIRQSDMPTAALYPGQEMTSEHRESIYIGYRYYLSAGVKTALPFGYGLSYTRFEYSDVQLENNTVSFSIRNSGEVKGREIAQLYVEAPQNGSFRPRRELKGFAVAELEPGETRRLSIELDEHSFAMFSVEKDAWICPAGDYKLLVGASCEDIRLEYELFIPGEYESVSKAELLPHYYSANVQAVPAEEFELLLGRPLPQAHYDIDAPIGYNDTLGQGAYKKGLAGGIYKVLKTAQDCCRLMDRGSDANSIEFIMNLPYRSLARMSGGMLNMDTLDKLLKKINK